MFKPELIRNKLYALLLIACTLPVMLLEGDATATVFIAMIAMPMFFAKENWILGGCGISDHDWSKCTTPWRGPG